VTTQINLETLRHEYDVRRALSPPPPGPRPVPADLLDGVAGASWSRQDFLAVTGTLAAGLLPHPHRLPFAPPDTLTVRRHGDQVTFTRGGREAWSIDAAVFAGRPRLTVRGRDVTALTPVVVELRGARYPGTSLALTLRATATRGSSGYQLRLEFLRCGTGRVGWTAEVPFQSWLDGHAEATAFLDTDRARGLLGGRLLQGLALVAPRGLRITADPALGLTLAGRSDLSGLLPTAVRSERVTLRALAPETPSLFADRPVRRSLLTVERGAQHWPAQLAHEHRDGWALRAQGRDLFSALRVEAADLDYVAQFIPDEQPEGHVHFHPAAALDGLRLERPSLVLARGRDRRDEQWAVVGDFPTRAGWLFHGGCGLELGAEAATAPFMLAASRAATRQLECAPAIRTLFAPLPGTVGRPLDLRGCNAHLTFHNPRVSNPHLRPMTTGPSALPAGRRSSVLSRPREREADGMMDAREGEMAATLTREGGRGVLQTPASSASSFSPLPRTGERAGPAIPRLGIGGPVSHGSGVRVAGLKASATVHGRDALHLRVSFDDASLSVGATRPKDLLLLSFGFVNLTLHITPLSTNRRARSQPARLVRTDPNAAAYLVVYFPPQHIVEDAFAEGDTADEGPILSIMSGESRLAFVIPHTVTEIPYTLEALLDWSRYDLSVAPTAVLSVIPGRGPVLPEPEKTSGRTPVLEGDVLPAGMGLALATSPALPHIQPPDIVEPTPTETSLEIPYRLMLSPSEVGAWVHATAPVTRENPNTHRKRTELWHTRLGVRLHKNGPIDENNESYRTVRAVFKRRYAHNPYIPQDYFEEHERTLKNRALTEVDLYQLVLLTALRGGQRHTSRGKTFYTPDSAPIAVNRLMLSALGGWLHAHGHWDTEALVYKETPLPTFLSGPVPLDLEDWRHSASMGRDHYVRTVHKGYLYPFGHRATFIIVTERHFEASPAGATGYLRQRYSVVVRERTVGFDLDHRGLHYGSVTITTATTPDIDPIAVPRVGSDSSSGTGIDIDKGGARAFVPYLGGTPFRFDMEGVDRAGHTTHWTQPLVFVRESVDSSERTTVANFYNEDEKATLLRQCGMSGQKVGFATPPAGKPDSTTLPTTSMTFSTNPPAVALLTPTLAALPSSPAVVTAKGASATSGRSRQGRRADATLKDLSPADLAAFFAPQLEQAQVTVQSIAQLTGKASAPLTAQLADHYLANGFNSANPGQVFMQFVHKDAEAVRQAAATFAADQAGGLVTPHLIPVGLSAVLGPIGGLGDGDIPTTPDTLKKRIQDSLLKAAKAQFDPLDFLGKESKILGDIGLADIIDVPSIPDPTHFESKGLKILTQTFYRGVDGQETTTMPQPSLSHPDPAQVIPIAIQTSIDWTPDVKSWPESDSIFLASQGGKAATLDISGKLRTELSGGSTGKMTYTMHGSLTNFSLVLLPGVAKLLQIDFSSLTFDAHTGGKPSVDPKISGVQFLGPLTFVNTLKSYISGGGGGGGAALLGPALAGAQPGLLPADNQQPATGNARPALPPNRHASRPPEGGVFGGSPSLDTTPAGITVGYTLPIPSVAVGVFSLQNIKLSAALGLPFNGDPVTVRFAFCERHDPFILSVSGFAGGGFLGITLSAKEIVVFEGALEFGGNVSLDLVVASGGVHVLAGIYFSDGRNATTGKSDFLLEGYLRAGGSLSVLGLITVSVEFLLALSYEDGVVTGTATLTVDIDLTLFHKSVDLTVTKTFAGSSSAALRPNGELAALPRTGLADAVDGVLPALNPDGSAAGYAATGRHHGLATADDIVRRFTDVMSERQWDEYIAAFE